MGTAAPDGRWPRGNAGDGLRQSGSAGPWPQACRIARSAGNRGGSDTSPAARIVRRGCIRGRAVGGARRSLQALGYGGRPAVRRSGHSTGSQSRAGARARLSPYRCARPTPAGAGALAGHVGAHGDLVAAARKRARQRPPDQRPPRRWPPARVSIERRVRRWRGRHADLRPARRRPGASGGAQQRPAARELPLALSARRRRPVPLPARRRPHRCQPGDGAHVRLRVGGAHAAGAVRRHGQPLRRCRGRRPRTRGARRQGRA
jgi:hypothetical protein